ncbi:MAG TPA: hypothetical protein VKD22_07950 [Ramlibacter sp.]|nr:hypothetical protein [Ramlibacter sp.]
MPWRSTSVPLTLYRLVPVSPTDTLEPGDYVVAGDGARDCPSMRFRVPVAMSVLSLISQFAQAAASAAA